MPTPLAYLIVNSLLLLYALRAFRTAKANMQHLVATPGTYRPWQADHRETVEAYQSARIMLLTVAVWLSLGQWLLLAGIVESGI